MDTLVAIEVAQEVSSTELYWRGYDAALAGAELGDMQTPAEKEGWLAAKADQDSTDDYEDWLEDVEYFRKGC